MNFLIINSHPYNGSFNAGIAKVLRETAMQKGHYVSSIDLIADGFNPVMSAEDLKLWGQGQTADPLVLKYQDEIINSNILIFPFPIWWGSMPAVLKGFCDKVLLPGWAYKYGDNGEMIGLLNNLKSIVITTMETPAEDFINYFNNPVDGGFVKDTLQTCGIEVIKYFLIDKIISGGREYTESKLYEIREFINEQAF